MLKKSIHSIKLKSNYKTLKIFIDRKTLLIRNLIKRDLINTIKYGRKAPKYCERVFVHPKNVNYYLPSGVIKKELNLENTRSLSLSGLVVNNSDIFKYSEDIQSLEKIKFCYMRWNEGKTWEETGVYDFYNLHIKNGKYIDGLKTKDQVKNRYKKLDDIFDEVRQKKSLRHKKN